MKIIVDFLVRWDFAEVRRFPSFHVRRKSRTISPTDVVDVLRAVNETAQASITLPKRGLRLAERVACRVCDGRSLRVIGKNEVECTKCHERQWCAIEKGRKWEYAAVEAETEPNVFKQRLVWFSLMLRKRK